MLEGHCQLVLLFISTAQCNTEERGYRGLVHILEYSGICLAASLLPDARSVVMEMIVKVGVDDAFWRDSRR